MTSFFVFLFSTTSVFMGFLALWFFFSPPKAAILKKVITIYDSSAQPQGKQNEDSEFQLAPIAEAFYSSFIGKMTRNLVVKVHGNDDLEFAKTFRLKILIGLTGISLSLLLLASEGGSMLWTFAPALGSFWVPDLLLKNEYDKKQIAIGSYLPDTIDLLNLCGEAGLGFEAAVSRVVAIRRNYITDELGRFLMEIQAGKTRSDSLTSLIQRNTNPEFIRFLTAIRQSERLGIPISKVLHEQAVDLRARFRDLAKEQAQKVTVKILAPVMLCFLPATFVVVLGPAILGLVEAFS